MRYTLNQMKFSNLAAFEKHLKEAFPAHLSRVYILVNACSFERKKIVEELTQLLQRRDPELQVSRLTPEQASIELLRQQLETRPLFGRESLIIFDGIEQLKKESLEKLALYLDSPSPFSTLVLTSGAVKNAQELYQKGKRECVFLDMHDEKPWDKEKRLKEWLIRELVKEKKSITPEAIVRFFALVGTERAALEQELSKLLLYSCERKQIDVSDVEKICSVHTERSSWQIVENLIWEEKLLKEDLRPDTSDLFPLIGQVRYHLHIGMEIVSLLQKGATSLEIGRALPTVRPQALEKYLASTRRTRADFFSKALHLLFDMELQAKNSSLSIPLLWDHFTAKLTLLKR